MSAPIALLVAFLLLIANAFFVAIEFGLIATQRAQLEDRAKEGNRRARSALNAITDLNTQIAGAQLGITMASIALGLIAEPAIAHWLEDNLLSGLSESAQHTVAIVIALTFVTFLHILIGEMVPKNIALADAPATAMWLSPIHTMFVRIAGPIVWLLNGMANGVLRLMGVTAVDERAQAKTPEELAMLLEEAHHGEVLDDHDFGLLSGTLELGGASIRDAVVPWASVDRAPVAASIAEIEERMAQSGHSRLILVGDDDEPMGWCHAKDLLAIDHSEWDNALGQHRRRRLIRVDHDSAAEDALEQMQVERAHFVLATAEDEPVGILTIEDVLEVLVSGLASAGSDS